MKRTFKGCGAQLLFALFFAQFPFAGNLTSDQRSTQWQQDVDTQESVTQEKNLADAAALEKRASSEEKQGGFQKALEDLQQALQIYEKLEGKEILAGETLAHMGRVHWQLGQLEDAKTCFQRALVIRQRLDPGSRDVALTLTSLGVVAWRAGDLRDAEEKFNQSLAIQQKLSPESLDVAATLNNLGNVLRERGDLVKAEEHFRQAQAIYEKFPQNGYLPVVILNLGDLAWDRGDLVEAERLYRKMLTYRDRLAPVRIAECLSNLGLVAWQRRDLEKAEEYLTQALAIREKISPESLDIAESLVNLGAVEEKRNELDKADQYDHRALNITEKLAPGSLLQAGIVSDLGNIARDRQDLEKAEDFYRKAVGIREALAPGSLGHAESLAALAMVLREQKQPVAATELFRKALDALENQSARLGGSEEVRSSFRVSHADYYQQYFELLMEQKQFGLAFQTLERSRARTLLEMLTESRVDIHKNITPEQQEQSRTLGVALKAKFDSLATAKSDREKTEALMQELRQLLAEYGDLQSQIRASNPKYAALSQPQVYTAEQVQHDLLDIKTVLLEYALGNERSYLWVVTAESLASYELPERTRIEATARRLVEGLTARNRRVPGETPAQRQERWTRADEDYQEAAEALSKMVIAPAAEHIRGKRLLIVGDGALQYIPFAVLPEPQGEQKPGMLVPLMMEHEIVELPSASTLAVLRHEHKSRLPAPDVLEVVADPVFDRDDDRIRLAQKPHVPQDGKKQSPPQANSATRSTAPQIAGEEGLGFSRLPFSRREAQTIFSIAPRGKARLLLDFQASKSAITNKPIRNFRILHLATHGVLNSEQPELSSLVFSLVDRQGRPQDGFLRLFDIYNLDLNADLVVLSACQTAAGKQMQREGVVGLTRGFMYAGAARVMSTLWSVDDEATAELMRQFYQNVLRHKQSPAEALRTAQMWMYTQTAWKAPYYWAAFVLQGEWK